MRGGRNMRESGAGTGEGDLGLTVVITTLTRTRTGPAFGSPRNPQHEQIPLQVSGAARGGRFTRGWGDDEITKYGPSHRSQCGEWTARHVNTAHNSHAVTLVRIVMRRSTLLTITPHRADRQRYSACY